MRLTFSSMVKFQSTLPVWGATAALHGNGHRALDFNPRSPCGERPLPLPASAWRVIFQSTLPVWGATGGVGVTCISQRISIHAPRVGSDAEQECGGAVNHISIHAPRVGSDATVGSTSSVTAHFNPRSPCGERQNYRDAASTMRAFQSTLPVWGATPETKPTAERRFHFNPRSPCGERLVRIPFSPSTLRFQSTLPVWGATRPSAPLDLRPCISIHAPRVGSDLIRLRLMLYTISFQSTLPVWGATF